MSPLYKLAAIAALGVACSAQAGVSPAWVDVQAAQVGVDQDTALLSINPQIDGTDFILNQSPAPSTYVTASNKSSLPVKQSAGPTVVPLPAAAPAGILTLSLIGFVGFIRRMRSRLTAPA